MKDNMQYMLTNAYYERSNDYIFFKVTKCHNRIFLLNANSATVK